MVSLAPLEKKSSNAARMIAEAGRNRAAAIQNKQVQNLKSLEDENRALAYAATQLLRMIGRAKSAVNGKMPITLAPYQEPFQSLLNGLPPYLRRLRRALRAQARESDPTKAAQLEGAIEEECSRLSALITGEGQAGTQHYLSTFRTLAHSQAPGSLEEHYVAKSDGIFSPLLNLAGALTILLASLRKEAEQEAGRQAHLAIAQKRASELEPAPTSGLHRGDCARFVVDTVGKNRFFREIATNLGGVTGNAWTMFSNLTRSGHPLFGWSRKKNHAIFNLFEDLYRSSPGRALMRKRPAIAQRYREALARRIDPKEADARLAQWIPELDECYQLLASRWQQVAPRLDLSTVSVGTVVGMMQRESDYKVRALVEGRQTFNTHVGIVTSVSGGRIVVSHFTDRLEQRELQELARHGQIPVWAVAVGRIVDAGMRIRSERPGRELEPAPA